MSRIAKVVALVPLLVVALATSAPAKSINSMAAIETQINDLAAKHGAGDVLVVFDIDDTLLKGRRDLGSNAWWDWQYDLLKAFNKELGGDPFAKPPDELVAHDFQELIDVQYKLFAMGRMVPVEGATPGIVRRLQDAGHKVFALTARGPLAHSVSVRELHHSDYNFETAPRCQAPLCTKRGIIPKEQLQLSALQAGVELPKKKLGPINYSDGVLTSAGQNKGLILRTFLASIVEGPFDAIVFVDDSSKNVRHVNEAFPGDPRVHAFHYTHMEEDVDDFLKDRPLNRKSGTGVEWTTLRKFLCGNLATACDHRITRLADRTRSKWSNVSGLAADPKNFRILYAVTDKGSDAPSILTIDVSKFPPKVIKQTPLDKGCGKGLDLEGITAKKDGTGFWVVSEGGAGDNPQNRILEVSKSGKCSGKFGLPDSLPGTLSKFGLEGITLDESTPSPVLYLAFQKPLEHDLPGHALIARVDVNSLKTSQPDWTFFHYPIDEAVGASVGLSELVLLGPNCFVAIERDNQSGTAAKLKRLKVFTLPLAQVGPPDGEIAKVKLGDEIDLRDIFKTAKRDVEEQIEGLAITPKGDVYVATDNDAGTDTLILKLGKLGAGPLSCASE